MGAKRNCDAQNVCRDMKQLWLCRYLHVGRFNLEAHWCATFLAWLPFSIGAISSPQLQVALPWPRPINVALHSCNHAVKSSMVGACPKASESASSISQKSTRTSKSPIWLTARRSRNENPTHFHSEKHLAGLDAVVLIGQPSFQTLLPRSIR